MSDLFDQLSQFAKRGVAAQRAADGIISQPIVHHKDPATSHEAADKMVESGALSRQEEAVWKAINAYIEAIRVAGSLHYTKSDFTAKDIFGSSTMSYYTIQRRLSGLRNHGKIERIQIEGIETHPKGNPVYKKRGGCCVWRIK